MLTVTSSAINADFGATNNLDWAFSSGSNSAFDFLAQGETLILDYTVKVADSHNPAASDTRVVSITITGTNDKPDISLKGSDLASAELKETDSGLRSSGHLSVEDLDLNDNVNVWIDSLVVGGTGSMRIPSDLMASSKAALLAMLNLESGDRANPAQQGSTENLSWSFNSGLEAFNWLAEGETLTLTYTLLATDTSPSSDLDRQTINIAIEGTKENPKVLTGTSVTANEASPYAVFQLDGGVGQAIRLELKAFNSDAEASAAVKGAKAATIESTRNPRAGTADIGSQLDIFDGKGWEAYTPGSSIVRSGNSSKLMVRVAVNNDSNDEGAEAFMLIAESIAGTSDGTISINPIRLTSLGIINDQGAGAIFGNSGNKNNNKQKDDDRELQSPDIRINEASAFGIFTINNRAETANTLQLSLTDSNQRNLLAEEGTFDLAQTLQVWNGDSWVDYANSINIAANSSLFVRIAIDEQDEVFEGAFVKSDSVGEGFRLKIITDNNLIQYADSMILDDGTGLIFTGEIGADNPKTTGKNLDDDLDKDGLSPYSEEILATLAASASEGGLPGDLNGDGLQDSEQTAVGTFAWLTADKFQAGLNGDLTEIKPIVSIAVMDGLGSNKVNSNYQLEKVEVLASGDVNLDKLKNRPDGAFITNSPWDAVKFAVAPSVTDTDKMLDDADPLRVGTQVRISIDVSLAEIAAGDFNAYYKYVSTLALSQYRKENILLRDLDGKPITQAGWYDFTRRTPNGDGVSFITKKGKLTAIDIILTDNSFGDNDATVGRILDPGAPLQVYFPSPEGQFSPENNSKLPSPQQLTQQLTPDLNNKQISQRALGNEEPKAMDYLSNGGNLETTTIQQRLRDQARNSLIKWSREAGLENLVTADQNPSAADSARNASTDGGRLDQSATALLYRNISAQGPALLEALALGAAGLYFTQAVGERNLEQIARQWIRRLRPNKNVTKAIGQYSQVLSIFMVQASGRRPKLVAAKILTDSIDIIAELPLKLHVPYGTDWDELDLSQAFDQIRRTLKEQFYDNQMLLLLDPLLKSYLHDLQDIGQVQTVLRHTDFNTVLRSLPNEELEILRHWLNRPSLTSLQHSPGCRQVMAQLALLQGHWINHMGESMANVAGVLELSIALGNLQPEHAMI